MQDITLNTGARMPTIGIGTWKLSPADAGPAVAYAIEEAGYRHVDCAAVYHNEPAIGAEFSRIFSSGNVKREEVFVTSKLWNSEFAPADVAKACKQTLADLKLDYLDLYLMHWSIAAVPDPKATQPNSRGELLDANGMLQTQRVPIHETWKEMEALVDAGLVRAIGVANFNCQSLVDLLAYARVKPAMNQIELHPYLQQTRLVEFCQRMGIAVTAYSPLGSVDRAQKRGGGEPIVMDDSVVKEMAVRYQKSPAQILIRWAVQRGTVAIPRSANPDHIKNNAVVLDFELSENDMRNISALDRHHRYVQPFDWWKIPYFD